jgi:hypothetical protein
LEVRAQEKELDFNGTNAEGERKSEVAMSHIKWRRAILGGLAANVASFFVGGGGYVIFGRFFKMEPLCIWRWTPEKTGEMSLTRIFAMKKAVPDLTLPGLFALKPEIYYNTYSLLN